MADLIPSLRYSTRKSSPSASSPGEAERSDYRTLGRDSSPVAIPTMANPISTPERSTRNYITAASNPAIAGRCDSAVQLGRDSPAVGSLLNKRDSLLARLRTPEHQTLVASQHGSSPSISSVNSVSTTGSSVQSDKFFDFRDSTQYSDSNPTSPEEDTSPIMVCGAEMSSLTIDSDCEVSAREESPLIDRERRKKSSIRSRPGLNPLKLSYKPFFNHQSTLNGTQHPNSALDDTSPTGPNSPSVYLDHSFQRLSLDEIRGTISLHRTRSASLRPPENFKPDQSVRATSASGRIEESVENGAYSPIAAKGQDKPSGTQMKLNSTNAVLPQATKRNYGRDLRGEFQTKGTRPQENVEKLAIGTGAQKDSFEPSIPSPLGARRISTTAVSSSQSGKAEVKTDASREKSVNRRKSSSLHKKPSKIPQVDSESEPEDEVQAIHPKDVSSALPLNAKRQSLPNRERSIRYSNAGNQDIEESGASSALSDRNDVQSEPDSTSEVEVESIIDEEPIYSTFKPFHKDSLSKGYIQEALISKIRCPWGKASKYKTKASELKVGLTAQKKEAKEPTWTQWGNIYVYSLEPFRQEAGIESKPTYRYLKVGFCAERNVIERIKEQQLCYKEKVIPVEDDDIRRFQFAKLVESLIKIEFREYRLKYPCRKLHFKKGKDGKPRNHGEWFEVDQQRLLDSIEKWRGWITENNPYHPEEYYLQPRWEWKINRISCKWRKLSLDDALKPFTIWEDLQYRRHWIYTHRGEIYTRVKAVASVLSRSIRLFVIFGASLYLISALGLTFVWACFVLVISAIVYIASGCDH